MEMSGALTSEFCQGSVGEIPGICFIYAKRAVNEKIAGCAGENSSGFANEQGGV